jgi:hypothetical protein
VPLNTAGINAASDGVAAKVGYVSLHSADPAGTGAHEITGGTPAYARKAVLWDPATGGVAPISGPVTFDIPPGTTISHAALWDTLTGGTTYGDDALSSPETYGAQGSYNLNALTITITSP